MTTSSLQDRVAIVTGAASGLGLATARRMVSEGARVAIADIDHARASAAASDLGDAAIALDVDVSDEESVRRMVGAVVDRFGQIDIVHNNAAALGLDVLGRDGDVVDMDVEVWDRTMAVNLRGAIAVLGELRPGRGQHRGPGALLLLRPIQPDHRASVHATQYL